MDCKTARKQYLKPGPDYALAEHRRFCESCNHIFEEIEQSLSILDEDIEMPAGLTEKVIAAVRKQPVQPTQARSYMKYMQMAAAVAGGIFIGVTLGANADYGKLGFSTKEHKERSLVNFRDDFFLIDSRDDNILPIPNDKFFRIENN